MNRMRRRGGPFLPNRCVIGLYLRRKLPWPAIEDLNEVTELILMQAPDLSIPDMSLLKRAHLFVARLSSWQTGTGPLGGSWHPAPKAGELAAMADLVELEAPHVVVSVASLWQLASMADVQVARAAMILAQAHKDLRRIAPGSTLAALAALSDLFRLLMARRWSTPAEALGDDHAVTEDLLRLARSRASRARGGEQLGLLKLAYKLSRQSSGGRRARRALAMTSSSAGRLPSALERMRRRRSSVTSAAASASSRARSSNSPTR